MSMNEILIITKHNKMKQSRRSKNPVEWWDEECVKAIEERKDKLKEYIKEQSMDSFIEYKRTRAIARKIIRQKKRENFINFVSNLNKNSNIIYVWNKMKVIKNSFKTVEWNKWQVVEQR